MPAREACLSQFNVQQLQRQLEASDRWDEGQAVGRVCQIDWEEGEKSNGVVTSEMNHLGCQGRVRVAGLQSPPTCICVLSFHSCA